MAGLRLHTSNRLEILADKLADVLREPGLSPLEPEVIVIQSRGMERWISMQLASRHGVCANYRSPFPNHFVQELFRLVLPDLTQPSPFEPSCLTWRIMGLLPRFMERPQFESLRNYLGKEGDDLKRLQLAERIADLFDQYLIFRPDMISAWEKGQGDHWQALLWRELVATCGSRHDANLARLFLQAIQDATSPIKGMPSRVSVFGISALPRFHMEIFAGISHVTTINLFLMNPCREYWGDIVTDWEIRRAMEKDDDALLENLHFEKGNSLLGSMGALGREFFDLLGELECEEFPFFREPEGDSLLAAIQSDILNLKETTSPTEGKRSVAPEDQSIRIHSCHSPIREMEVLYDQLLEMFAKNPGLEPRDILVMAPDIESYAPYIQAVFDMPRPTHLRIPYSIADRNIRRESPVIDAFLRVLDLRNSRFCASEVMAILESPAVRSRFGLHEPDLRIIEQWISQSGIRWGIDAQSRARRGLPALSENTWRAGLERLLLGYAMPGKGEMMFQGILPFDEVEGEGGLVLGRFCQFAETLFARAEELQQPRSLDEWATSLGDLLDTFFAANEEWERDLQALHRIIFSMREMAGNAGFQEQVDVSVVRWHLGRSAERKGYGFGFITGGVTFCALLPMRSIPFRVICLVGMNHDAYPRQTRTLGFDLMAQHPRKGDRSRRNDDRYLFLEALLSAKERLYISHVGQSIQDNSPIPPSVLVSELVDYMDQGFHIQSQPIRDHLIIQHRLQPFSPAYFKRNERLISYSHENLETARCLVSPRKTPAPFIPHGLPAVEEEWTHVSLEDLCRFFENPAKYLLSKRLGIYLREGGRILQDKEPFEVTGLERYQLEQELAKRALSGANPRDALSLYRASGRLPHGTLGTCIFEGLSNGVEAFVQKTRPLLEETPMEPVEAVVSIGNFTLAGKLENLYGARLIRYRYARITANDRLRAWISHLFLNAADLNGYPATTALLGLDPGNKKEARWLGLEYRSLTLVRPILEQLLKRYWQGLQIPLHFFSNSSWEYARLVLRAGKDPDYALSRILPIWRGNEYTRGEREDLHVQQCFGNTDPLDGSFHELALEIFGSLMEHETPLQGNDKFQNPKPN